MLLDEVFIEDINEVELRGKLAKAAAVGALGAGILGGLYGMNKSPAPSAMSPPQIQAPQAPITTDVTPTAVQPQDIGKSKPAQSTSTAVAHKSVIPGAAPHPKFPSKLVQQADAKRDERIRNFKHELLPSIRKMNSDILRDRKFLAKIINTKYKPSKQEQSQVLGLADRYNVSLDDETGKTKPMPKLALELLRKVDIVPEYLVLAQAALETGWGTSDLARQANNFFGQKATHKHQPHEKVKNTDGLDYRAYIAPINSIKSYMHNLNTHRAYSDFRQKRTALKKQKNINAYGMSKELAKHLQAYSTNPNYESQLTSVMSMLQSIK